MSDESTNDGPVFDDDGEMIREPDPIYPALYLTIDPPDPAYNLGFRFRVDQLDGAMHFFTNKHRAVQFILREGLELLDYDEMLKRRRAAGIDFRYDDEIE